MKLMKCVAQFWIPVWRLEGGGSSPGSLERGHLRFMAHSCVIAILYEKLDWPGMKVTDTLGIGNSKGTSDFVFVPVFVPCELHPVRYFWERILAWMSRKNKSREFGRYYYYIGKKGGTDGTKAGLLEADQRQ
jgi:hypothetical protein